MGYTGTPLYNGNISETYWRTASDNTQRKYGYKYDNLNRLRESIYQKPGNANPVPKSYDENLTYDKNGNILSLLRNGDIDGALPANVIDNLAYTYPANSNQLSKVADVSNNTSGFKDGNTTGDDYSYDANGSLTTDKNKNITEIVYNHLNLPTKITFGTTGNISFIYNSTGQKVQKIVTEGTTVTKTDYLDGFLYKNAVLQYFPTAEGYFQQKEGSPLGIGAYVFQHKDHLGNVRLSYTKNPVTNVLEIIEESNYYPGGLIQKGYNNTVTSTNPGQKLLFNGKELQDELGLDWFDFGARMLDRQLNIWRTIDPKAELLETSSPYVYALNCPIVYLDQDGELPILINGKTSADSERASSSYWGTEIINTIKGSGIANPGGQFHYVDGNRGLTSDDNATTDSYSAAKYAADRSRMGAVQAEFDWEDILSKLEKDPKTGKVIEKIQIYTHSRGGAFGQGYTEELLKLIKSHSSKFADAGNVIDFVFDMAPHQSDDLDAVKGVSTYTMDHEGDILSDNDKGGVKGAFTSGEAAAGIGGSHKIASFGKDLKEFAKAFNSNSTKKGVIDTFVKNMKNNYGIKVTVQE